MSITSVSTMWEICQCPLVVDLPLQVHTPSALHSGILDSEWEDMKMLSEEMSTMWHGYIYLAVLDKLQVAGE